jgi:hypothetical protein
MNPNHLSNPNQPSSVTPQRIMQFAWGYAPTLAIEAAVRHGVFDLLDQGPKGVEEIAKATGTSIRGMRAILNLLVSLELLERTDTRYGLAPESAAFLVSTKPGYHGMFFHHISDQLLPRWMQLSEIVRTGKPVATVNDQSEGAAFFAEFVESLFPIIVRGYSESRFGRGSSGGCLDDEKALGQHGMRIRRRRGQGRGLKAHRFAHGHEVVPNRLDST